MADIRGRDCSLSPGGRGILDARSLEPQQGGCGIGVTPYGDVLGTRSRNPSIVPESRQMLRRVAAFVPQSPERIASRERAHAGHAMPVQP